MGQLANILTLTLDDDPDVLSSDGLRSVGLADQAVGDGANRIIRYSNPNVPGVIDQLNFSSGFALSINGGLRIDKSTVTTLQEEEWCVLRLRLSGKVDERLGEQSFHFEGANGSLLYCSPGVTHSLETMSEYPVEGVSVIFQPSTIESRVGGNFKELLERLNQGRGTSACMVSIELSSEIKVLVRELIDAPRTGQFFRFWAEVKALELICLALTALESRSEKSTCRGIRLRPWDVKQLEAVKALLDVHYCAPPSIEALCGHSGLNRRKLTEGFKILFSCTTTEYIQSQRMLRARSLLRQSLPIKLVAEKVGYNDPSSFTKIFRRQFGVLPRVFSNPS